MADSYSVVAKLSADVGNFTKGMATAQASLKNLESNVKGMNLGDVFKGAGDVLASTGKALTMGVTLPLAALGTMAVKTGMDFEKQMNRVSAISGATGDDLAKLEQQAIDLGASSIFGATEVAQSQEMLASAGLTTNEILAATPGIMDLAAVSGGDMALASEAAATAMNQFGLDASESTHVADVFARAAADTNAETMDMAEALKYAGPVAGALGISLEETAAAIGIMSDAGIKGSQAGTTMRGALSRLAKPTEKARDVMNELGLSFFDAQGDMLPFGEIVGQLQGKLGGLTQEQKQQAITTLFGQEAMSGMLALIGSAPGEFDALTASLENSDGSAKSMADTMNSGLAGAVEQLKGSLESAAIAISKTLGPMIEKLSVHITGLVDAFNSLTPAQQENIVKWAGIAAVAGPVLFVLGKAIGIIATVVGGFFKLGGALKAGWAIFKAGEGVMAAVKVGMLAITGPVGWVVVAILALIAVGVALWANWDAVSSFLSETWSTLKDAAIKDFTELKEKVTEAFSTLKSAATEDWTEIKTAVTTSSTTLKDAAISDWTELKDGTSAIFGTLKTQAISDWEQIKNGISIAFEATKTFIITVAVGIYNGIVTIFSAVGAFFVGVWASITSAATTAWSAFTTIVGNYASILVTNITTYFGFMAPMLETIWVALQTGASAAWELIKNLIIGPVLILLEMLRGNWEGAASALSQIWENIKLAAVTIFTSLGLIVSTVFSLLIQGIVALATMFWDKMVVIFTNIKTAVVQKFIELKTSTIETWTALKEYLSTTVEAIKVAIVSKFESLKSSAIQKFLELKTSAIENFNNLKASSIAAIEGLKAGAIAKFEELKAQAKAKVAELKTSAIENFNNLKESASTAIENLKTAVVEGFNNMVNSAVTKAEELPSEVGSAFNDAVDRAKEFASDAVEAGKQLIAGFVKGVADKASSLADSVGGAIGGAIDKAKNLLGIASPSKLFTKFGKFTDQGFINGIDAYAGKAKKAMGNMINGATSVFDPTALQFNSPTVDIGGMVASSTGSVNSAISHSINQPSNTTDMLLERLISSRGVVMLDTGAIVGGTYNEYDRTGGTKTQLTERWGR